MDFQQSHAISSALRGNTVTAQKPTVAAAKMPDYA
jgi:hypothetical protein